MENRNTSYRSKTNRVFETILREVPSPIFLIKTRKFIIIPLAVICIILASFFLLIGIATGFEALLIIFSLAFGIIGSFSIFALVRKKVIIDSMGITYTMLFKTIKFTYSDVEKYITKTIKQVISYNHFIKLPAGTERTFEFYLKGHKSPFSIPLVYDSRSTNFIEDRLIEKELDDLDALLKEKDKKLKWQESFLRSLRDELVELDPQLYGLRQLLINALYICGPNSPYHTFSGSYTTLYEAHVESWLREGFLTNIEKNWRQKWYTELPIDWEDQWLSCMENYVNNHSIIENLDRIKNKMKIIRDRLY